VICSGFAGTRRKLFLRVLLILIHISLYAEDPETEEDFPGEEALIMEGEGLTVVGTPETTQQMRILTKEEIDRVHAPDLASLLEQTLDLPVTRYGPYGNVAGINMRGFGSGRVAFLVDGIPATSPQSGEFEISMIDVNSIERIEIIYGGSDTKYNVSGAIGGVINIITVKKQKPGWRAGGSLSNTAAMPGKYYTRQGKKEDAKTQELFDTQNISFFTGLGTGDFSWAASLFANRAQNHFTFEDTYGTTRRRENNEVWDAGAATSFTWDLPESAEFVASADLYYGDKNIPGPMYSASIGNQEDFSTRQTLMLDMPYTAGDTVSMEAGLSHTWQTLDYEDPASDSLHKIHSVTAINRWTWRFLPELILKTGGDYTYNHLDSTNIGIKDGHDTGVYVAAEYAPHESFLAIPSVKMVSRNTITKALPKFGLIWYAADSLTFKNNYFRSFKFPDFNDLYWAGDATAKGNPDLKPEDGIGTDFTVDYRQRNLFSLQSTLYAQRIRDSIHWRSVGGILEPINVGKADYLGWDSRVTSDFSEHFILSLSYQYIRTYILTGDFRYSSNIRMPYIPMHTVGVSAQFRWETGSLLISGHYEGLRYTDYTAIMNTGELDPHFILNISFNQKMGKTFTLFAVLRNALNESYVSMLDYPMPGITLTTGLKAVFE
jgi:vitamin B12 transporter